MNRLCDPVVDAEAALATDFMATRPLIIVGAGGHGRVCAEVAAAQGLTVAGFVDRIRMGQTVNGIPVIAADIPELQQMALQQALQTFVAIGDNDTRLTLAEALAAAGYSFARLQHPSTIVSPTARIAPGSVLMPGVIVNANSIVGAHCILNTACSIDHDNVLGEGAQLGPGVRAAGTVTIGRKAFVGTGASIKPGVTIGESAVVGLGSAVIRDVPSRARVAGVPAISIGPARSRC